MRSTFLVLLLAACGTDPSTPSDTAGPGAFAGSYSCTVTQTVTIPPAAPRSSTSMDSLSVTPGTTSAMLLDLGDGCIVQASRSGTSASFLPSQSCTSMGTVSSFSTGTATVAGTSLSVTYQATLSGMVTGTLSGTMVCTRR